MVPGNEAKRGRARDHNPRPVVLDPGSRSRRFAPTSWAGMTANACLHSSQGQGHLPVEGDDPSAAIKLARHALSLIQFDEETGDVLVNRLDFRQLRKNT